MDTNVVFSVPVAVAALLAAAVLIGFAGTRLAHVVDEVADRTGLGEAVVGAVLMGGATSLSGLVVTIVAATEGDASLAVANSVGGIAVQTTFIVVADLVYWRVNLEHAAASLGNILNSFLLLILLAIVLLGAAGPHVTVLGVDPVTLLLVAGYVYGVLMVRRVEKDPMWKPTQTPETEEDVPDPEKSTTRPARLAAEFVALALVVLASGFVVARAGLSLVAEAGVSGTVVGTLATSVTTSMPELVTSVAAVRAGALTLAVGGIVGGNAFDLLFIAVADLAYRPGSVYAALVEADLFVLGWAMLLVGILGTGLVRRQERGIGFEGVGVLVGYVAGLLVLTQLL